MYCKKCGAYNPEGSRFCSNCNSRLVDSHEEVTKKLISDTNVLNKTPIWVYFVVAFLILGIAIVGYNIYLLTNEKSNQTLVAENDQSSNSTNSSTLNNNQDETTEYYKEHPTTSSSSGSSSSDNSYKSSSSGSNSSNSYSSSSDSGSSSSSSSNSSSSGSSSSSSSDSSSSGSSSSNASSNNQYAPASGTHTYKVCMGDITWNEAVEKAASMGGYLAHIDSEAEFDEVVSQIRSYRNSTGNTAGEYYIGGRRNANDKNYYWTDQDGDMYGDPVNSKLGSWFWMEDEPSYYDHDTPETVLTILSLNDGAAFVGNDSYYDVSAENVKLKNRVGYVVEFEN